MIRVSTKDIIDILPYGDGKAILVEKKPLVNSAQFKAEYSVIDFENKSKNVLTKNAYLLKKFGSSFKEISETIPNFVQCEAGIFSREGELSWSGYFNYHDEIVSGLALDGKYFWSICPSENSVIRYYSQTMQVDLRIGGKDASTFLNPTHISADSGDIFVCCGGNKVRRIDGNDFTVSDYLNFDEQIKQYHRFDNHSIAVLSSGTYLLDE